MRSSVRLAARAALLAGAGLLSPGCSSYAFRDRMHDLAQIVDLSFTMGPGLVASARVTEVAQAGVGWYDGHTAGLLEGRFALAKERRLELGLSLAHTYEIRRESDQLLAIRQPYYDDPGYVKYPLSWEMESDRGFFDLGLQCHFFLGFNLAIHPGELVDFLAGCIGLDPQRDDAWGRSLKELRQQARSLDATTRRRAFDALLRRGEDIHGYAIYTARDTRPSFQRRAMEAVDVDPDASPADTSGPPER